MSSTKPATKSPRASLRKSKIEEIPFEFKTMNPDANLRPELKEKIEAWILSFYHLDPRYKILTFFNLVASEGADNVTDDQVEEGHSYATIPGGSSSSGPLSSRSSSNSNGAMGRVSSISTVSSSSINSTRMNSTGGANRDTYKVNAHLVSRPSARNIRPSTLSLLSSLFNATSILTVWRPCSNDAMRKMMEGTGVGKGLDIKGKSAKKGSLSAYVPFMQIFHNEHKDEIQPIGETAEMRIYYKDVELRDHVYGVLEKFKKDGPTPKKTKKKASKKCSNAKTAQMLRETSVVATLGGHEAVDEAIIAAESAEFTPTANPDESENYDDLLDDLLADDSKDEAEYGKNGLPPHKDPESPCYLPDNTKLKRVKKFAKTGFYGIECSQRLFWYATIQDSDISRVGTGTETGRPSLPGFQDANMKTLKVAQSQMPKPNPMPVVMQCRTMEEVKKEFESKQEEAKDEGAGGNHPLDGSLDARHLVMAYEEQGTIKPVVSDFDGFLLGWRREALWFGCNLPRDQESLMMWCVDRIEEILDDQKKNPTNSDTWTIRWLDVLKKAAEKGFHIDVPEYGFGDPKSTSIMEHAAMKLKSTGAVRHGSECFNYQFPQEIDEMFLLISDTLKPVPWKYVNVKELQVILSKKIAEGFVFPLNPKWILCDPGWKKIYDDLMASDALYADLSKDVWYPPYSGVRERIEKIHKAHPNGFQRCTSPSKPPGGGGKPAPHGRRQSASNILRDTLKDGVGSQLTGNAFADLAQLELDDFVGRTSVMPMGNMSNSMLIGNARDASLTIEELEDEISSAALTTSTANTSGKYHQRSPSNKMSSSLHEKRPSVASHSSSIASSASDTAAGNPAKSTASSSSSHTPKPLRKLLKGAIQSTRFVVRGHKKSSKSKSAIPRGESLGDAGSVASQTSRKGSAEIPSSRGNSRKMMSELPDLDADDDDDNTFARMDSRTKMINSKEMNREPRRHFTSSGWSKIIKNK